MVDTKNIDLHVEGVDHTPPFFKFKHAVNVFLTNLISFIECFDLLAIKMFDDTCISKEIRFRAILIDFHTMCDEWLCNTL